MDNSSPRPICYIAGPLGATTDNPDIELNIKRALALGALAARKGLSPFVPHAQGFGVFQPLMECGTLHETDEGRYLALECARDTVIQLARLPSSQFWGILNDDETASAGTLMEYKTWMYHTQGSSFIDLRHQMRKWADWCAIARLNGLGDLFASLV